MEVKKWWPWSVVPSVEGPSVKVRSLSLLARYFAAEQVSCTTARRNTRNQARFGLVARMGLPLLFFGLRSLISCKQEPGIPYKKRGLFGQLVHMDRHAGSVAIKVALYRGTSRAAALPGTWPGPSGACGTPTLGKQILEGTSANIYN